MIITDCVREFNGEEVFYPYNMDDYEIIRFLNRHLSDFLNETELEKKYEWLYTRGIEIIPMEDV